MAIISKPNHNTSQQSHHFGEIDKPRENNHMKTLHKGY